MRPTCCSRDQPLAEQLEAPAFSYTTQQIRADVGQSSEAQLLAEVEDVLARARVASRAPGLICGSNVPALEGRPDLSCGGAWNFSWKRPGACAALECGVRG